MKLFNHDATHWYTRSGEACHTVVGAGGMERATTVRDARRLGLLPSVTNVLGVVAKPELTAWKMEQAVVAALTLPRLAGESVDAFAARVAEDSESARRAAAEFGTRFHAAAAALALSPIEVDRGGEMGAWIGRYADWFHARVERVVWVERALVCGEAGYGGTADALFFLRGDGLALIDIKTQGNLKGGKPRKYSSWGYQLAAYRRALRLPEVRCMNLVVNAAEAGPPVEMWWDEAELAGSLDVFLAAALIWRLEKKYDPRVGGRQPGNGWETIRLRD